MTTPTTTRRGFVATAAALAATAAATSAQAQPSAKPDATIEFTLFRAGFIVGGTGGSGLLHFKDNGYPLGVGGVSFGATIGVARIEMTGEELADLRELGIQVELVERHALAVRSPEIDRKSVV